MSSYYIIQVGRILIPIFATISIFLFVLNFWINKEKKIKTSSNSIMSMIDSLAESEVAEILEMQEEKFLNKVNQLNRWNRLWFKNYIKAGKFEGEDFTYPGKNIIWYIIIGGLIGFVIASIPGLVLGLFATPCLIYIRNSNKGEVRALQTDSQIIMLAQAMQQSIASGMIPSNAFTTSIKDIPYPLKKELEQVKDRIDSGASFEESFAYLSETTESRELKFFCATMIIAANAGGDIQPQLEVIVNKLENRKSIKEKISEEVSRNTGALYVVGGSVPLALLISASGLLNFNSSEMTGMANTTPSSAWASPIGLVLLTIAILLWGAGLFLVNMSIRKAKNF